MNLQAAWKDIEYYIGQGISVLPVHDTNNDGKVAKSPAIAKWNQLQSKRFTPEEMFNAMERANTGAFGIIAGQISGNLEIIDIDTKYREGIDTALFDDIRSLYPDIWEKIRIHRTPSGGHHILYRVKDVPVEGNRKIAGYYNAEGKETYFIETRGEGGYVVAPPSLGYSVTHGRPIPTLTLFEKNSLMSLCRSYNETYKVQKEKQTFETSTNGYYSTNPFDEFKHSQEALELLTAEGWTMIRQNGRYIYFNRPHSRNPKDVHASFDKEKKIYKIFTTSEGLQTDKSVTPATLLAELKYNTDMKACYKALVANGFGKLTKEQELRTIKYAIQNHTDLPANISEAGKKKYQKDLAEFDTKFKCGIFWAVNEKGNIEISRLELSNTLNRMGFRNTDLGIVRIDGFIIKSCQKKDIFNAVRDYITDDPKGKIYNAFSAFFKDNIKHLSEMELRPLDKNRMHRSSRLVSYKYYRNGFVRITPTDIELRCYDEWIEAVDYEMYIYDYQYIDRDFILNTDYKETVFYDFVNRAIECTPYVMNTIGYLCHDYKDKMNTYGILLAESTTDTKTGGGVGKDVLMQCIALSSSVKTVDGKTIKVDEKMLQAWNGERIFYMADIVKRFNFSLLNQAISGTSDVKKLYQNVFTVPFDEMPKIAMSTNFSFEISDGGVDRRLIVVEFNDFFKKRGGVGEYYKKVFPDDWDTYDWSGFDTTIAKCIQVHLASNGKIVRQELSTSGFWKQYEIKFPHVLDFVKLNINEWLLNDGMVSYDAFSKQYESYCNTNNIMHKFRLTGSRMNDALKEYCKKENIVFTALHSYNGTVYRKFGSQEISFDLTEELPF